MFEVSAIFCSELMGVKGGMDGRTDSTPFCNTSPEGGPTNKSVVAVANAADAEAGAGSSPGAGLVEGRQQ